MMGVFLLEIEIYDYGKEKVETVYGATLGENYQDAVRIAEEEFGDDIVSIKVEASAEGSFMLLSKAAYTIIKEEA